MNGLPRASYEAMSILGSLCINLTHSSERDNESSKVVFHVEGFHHASVDFLHGGGTVARDIAMVGKCVKSRCLK